MNNLAIAFMTIIISGQVLAGVEINQDAITRDSVYPEFLHNQAVKDKDVSLKGKTQLGLYGGMRKNDAYFTSVSLSVSATYHFAEAHAAQLFISKFSSSQTDDSKFIDSTTSIDRLDLAPKAEFLTLAVYKWLPFYGKYSFAKDQVFNFNLYLTAGPGAITFEGKPFPALNLGIGQDLYFKNGWGLNLDLRSILFEGPDAVSIDLKNETETPDIGRFSKIFTFNLLLNIGVVKVF